MDIKLNPSRFLLARLESALNACAAVSPDVEACLAELDGHTLALHFNEFGTPLLLTVRGRHIHLATDSETTADVSFAGRLADFVRARLAPADSRNEAITTSGDTELAVSFSRLLRALDPDWEELLAGRIGDVAAHGLGRLFRGARTWGSRALASTGRSLGEYLQYETPCLPPRHEVESFLAAVDSLRDDVARLEAHISRFGKRMDAAP